MAHGDVTDFPFKNNVPDPLLSGRELPTFKFALEQSRDKVIRSSHSIDALARVGCPDRWIDWSALRAVCPSQPHITPDGRRDLVQAASATGSL